MADAAGHPSRAPAGERSQSGPHRSISAARALALLDTVARQGTAGVREAAAATGIPTSTALRHLSALVEDEYIERDRLGRYLVGPALVRLALATLQSGPHARLVAAAQPQLEALVDITEESAYLAVRAGDAALYIATAESRRAIRHVGWVGRSVPLDGTAVGAALRTPSRAPDTRPPSMVLIGAVEPDVTAVTAPVFDDRRVVAALSILGPSDRIVGERLDWARLAVTDAARCVSISLSSHDLSQGGRG